MKERVEGFLWPIPGRRVAAGAAWVLGMGRLGLFSVGSATVVSAWVYGLALVLVSIGLIFTDNDKALRWYGRLIASVGAGVLMGLGVDVGLQMSLREGFPHGMFNTSSVILYWLAIVLFFEAGARRGR